MAWIHWSLYIMNGKAKHYTTLPNAIASEPLRYPHATPPLKNTYGKFCYLITAISYYDLDYTVFIELYSQQHPSLFHSWSWRATSSHQLFSGSAQYPEGSVVPAGSWISLATFCHRLKTINEIKIHSSVFFIRTGSWIATQQGQGSHSALFTNRKL